MNLFRLKDFAACIHAKSVRVHHKIVALSLVLGQAKGVEVLQRESNAKLVLKGLAHLNLRES